KHLSRLLDRRHANLDVGDLLLAEDNSRLGAGEAHHLLGKSQDRRRLLGVADVENLSDGLILAENAEDPVNEIIDITPGTDLIAVSGDAEVFVLERADTELSDRPFADLPRTVDVERSHHGDG